MEGNLGLGTVKLDLMKLDGAEIVTYKDREYVAVPIGQNGIFRSERGGCYLSFWMSPRYEEKWGSTHTLKRCLSKEEMSLPKEQWKKTPICGSFSPYKSKEAGNTTEQSSAVAAQSYSPQPKAYQQPGSAYQPIANAPQTDGQDVSDLPF